MVAGIVIADRLLEPIDELRSLGAWSDEAHLPLEHIPELGKFIDIPPAHEGPNPESAIVILASPASPALFLGIELHAADLDDLELASSPSDAPLAIEDRTG